MPDAGPPKYILLLMAGLVIAMGITILVYRQWQSDEDALFALRRAIRTNEVQLGSLQNDALAAESQHEAIIADIEDELAAAVSDNQPNQGYITDLEADLAREQARLRHLRQTAGADIDQRQARIAELRAAIQRIADGGDAETVAREALAPGAEDPAP